MQSISLSAPPELSFNNSVSNIRMLTLQNTCLQKLVFKIRTNNKTALSMTITHDFLPPMSKRQIPIKLMEVHVGVKLEINYAKATEQMILKNDAKMVGIDKKDIKKCIVSIDVSDIIEKKVQSLDTSAKTQFIEEELYSSLHNPSPTSNKVEKEKSMNSSIFKAAPSEILDVVQQHPEEDEQQLQERKRVLEHQLVDLEQKIVEENKVLSIKRNQLQSEKVENRHQQPFKIHLLLPALVLAFFFGGLIKVLLY